jgi:hypothetical protein
VERLPRWPIAVGLVLWSIAGYVAYTGVWWPLVVIAVVSVLPGLGIGVMALVTRRMKREATAVMEPSAPAPGDPVAEPPRSRPSNVRTNARNAGRKRGGGATASLLLFASLLASEGCEKIERARAERRAKEAAEGGEPASDGATPKTADTPTPTPTAAAAPVVDEALDRALAIAITPPAAGEASWRVDPFVAALVFERGRSGALPFTKLDAAIPEGPSAGFRAGEIAEGSLLHRLGLRTGDVVESIGGVVLTDASRIGFALDGAQNRVDVTVFKDGMSVVHSYRLTEGLAWKSVLADFTGGELIAAAPDTPDPTGGAAPIDEPDPAGGTPSAGGTKPTTPSSGGTTPSGGGGTKPTTPGGGGTKPTTPGGGTTPSSGSDPVRCESASKCTVTKAYFDKMVASPSALQSQATIVPAIANDVHSGYKLKTVKSGSAVHKLGFRSGDKITHINGKDLTDEMQAAGLYLGMSSTSVFKIRFERGGSSQVKTVVVD